METEYQESTVNKKLLALVAVVLVLLLVAFCYVIFLLIRSRQTVQTLPAQPEIPLPTSVITVERVALFLPVVVNLAAPVSPVPPAITVPTSTVWRFLSINENDIGTFENVGDPNQRLIAKCIDVKRPAPDKGALYTLDNSGILKPQGGSKKIQRFELITRQ